MSEILFITHKYPPSIGGMERQSFELIEGVKRHAKVHLLAYNSEEESIWSFYFNIKKRVKKLLADHPDISVIHCNDGTVAAIASWLKRDTNKKVTATLHGLDVVFPNKTYQNKIINRIKTFDMIFAVSDATAQECIKRDFDPKKVMVIPNGVDHDIADIAKDDAILEWVKDGYGIDLSEKKIIVTVGRTVKRKGFSWFAQQVMPELDDDVVFVMIGPFAQQKGGVEAVVDLLPNKLQNEINLLFGHPSDQKNIRAILKNDALNGRIFHLGKLPFKKMMQLLSRADIFVMPNLDLPGDFEGFGLVALEACLRDTMVLAANIQGITDAIHDGKNGYMLPTKDKSAWVNKINELLVDQNHLDAKAKEFKQYSLDTFGWKKMSQVYLKAFNELMQED